MSTGLFSIFHVERMRETGPKFGSTIFNSPTVSWISNECKSHRRKKRRREERGKREMWHKCQPQQENVHLEYFSWSTPWALIFKGGLTYTWWFGQITIFSKLWLLLIHERGHSSHKGEGLLFQKKKKTDLLEHRPEITWRGRNSENKAPVGPRDQDSQSGEAHIAILCFCLGASYEQIENSGDSY